MSLIAQAIGTRLWNVDATTLLAPLLPFTPPHPVCRIVVGTNVTFRKAISRFTSGTDTQFTLSPTLASLSPAPPMFLTSFRFICIDTFVTETAGASRHFQLGSEMHRNAAFPGFRRFVLEFVFNVVWYFASRIVAFSMRNIWRKSEEFYGGISNMSILSIVLISSLWLNIGYSR